MYLRFEAENPFIGAITKSGAGVAAAADEGHLDAKVLVCPFDERLVEVGGGVGEGRENENLSVRLESSH